MSDGTIINGDVFDILPLLEDESVQCCVTSPPYWGLRDYGTATWEGGSADCDHVSSRGLQGQSGQRHNRTHTQPVIYKDICGKCGSVRLDSQLGLESTPEEYVQRLVTVFREVKRLLKPDGTLWLNLGDTYAGGGNGGGGSFAKDGIRCAEPGTDKNKATRFGKRGAINGIKSKDLVGIPWMVAFALRADGWYLRQDIIWAKPNPMPESVRDRCTKSHEYLFLLSKSPKYYFDNDAIKEPAAISSVARWEQNVEAQTGSDRVPGKINGNMKAVGGPRLRKAGNKNHKYVDAYDASSTEEHRTKAGLMKVAETEWAVRNKRDVWSVTTRPYKGAHFATFPPKLVEPCILAGSRHGDIVLDPFGGSGTVAQVAKQCGRDYLLIELNASYCDLAQQRIDSKQSQPLWKSPKIEWMVPEVTL